MAGLFTTHNGNFFSVMSFDKLSHLITIELNMIMILNIGIAYIFICYTTVRNNRPTVNDTVDQQSRWTSYVSLLYRSTEANYSNNVYVNSVT